MNGRIKPNQISAVFSKVLHETQLITEEDSSLVFIDLSFLDRKINELKTAFPKSTFHASAIKANPLVSVLKFVKTNKLGFESASLPELYSAMKTGISPDRILFDSPAKTINELKYALEAGVYINADSLSELERIDHLLKKIKSKSKIGLRINPQVGTGKIKITSVAGKYSKFGVPLSEKRKEIINAYKKYNWLCGTHLHIGSQGCTIQQLVNGVKKVYELAEEINSKPEYTGSKNRIKYFDIGGGLPVTYLSNKKEINIGEYSNLIKTECPFLFNGKYKLITEFGRWIFANSAWAVSRIEYVKKESNYNTLIIHLGADMFIRESYNPKEWLHEFFVLDKNGKIIKSKRMNKFNIAGPLCFAGDIIGRNIKLSYPSQDDFLVIRDVGAYTFSMWSRYNSRQMPKIIGYLNNGKSFKVLRYRESTEKVRKFWL
jgi:diaminopimelate decarboxylase